MSEQASQDAVVERMQEQDATHQVSKVGDSVYVVMDADYRSDVQTFTTFTQETQWYVSAWESNEGMADCFVVSPL
jgi:hypothetical protein